MREPSKACVPRFEYAGILMAAVILILAADSPGLLAGEAEPRKSLLERVELYGDLRLRHESNFDLDDQPDRHRQRFRFRMGVDIELGSRLSAGARIITGNPDDPQSPHQTFGEVFDSSDVSLDRAFLAYEPARLSGLRLRGGKFGHAFIRNPVYGELVWDADVQGEGMDVRYVRDGSGVAGKIEFTAARYSLLEQGGAGEAVLSAGQLAAHPAFGRVRSTFAVGYYSYSQLTPGGSLAIIGDNAGNAVRDIDNDGTPDRYVSGFEIVNPILAISFGSDGLPVTLGVEYIQNLEADGELDQGWAAGLKAGRSGQAGDWQVYYQRQVVEQDAVFTAVAQDDFLFGSNHRSHVAGVKVQALKRVQVHLWGLVSRRDVTFPGLTNDSDRAQWRVRLDINAAF